MELEYNRFTHVRQANFRKNNQTNIDNKIGQSTAKNIPPFLPQTLLLGFYLCQERNLQQDRVNGKFIRKEK